MEQHVTDKAVVLFIVFNLVWTSGIFREKDGILETAVSGYCGNGYYEKSGVHTLKYQLE